MKEWKCVLVKRHDNVNKVIEEGEQSGWYLHTCRAVEDVGMATAFVNQYLMFEQGE